MSGIESAPPGEGKLPIWGRLPDLFEPVLGYRLWRVSRPGELRSLVRRERWGTEINEAGCWRPGRHEAPGRLCTCGLNALHELPAEPLGEYRGTVLGAIAAWGEIEVHKGGFRAQFARVIALAEGGTRRPPARRRIERAARRYGVPLVPVELLTAVAEPCARPVEPGVLRGAGVAARSGTR